MKKLLYLTSFGVLMGTLAMMGCSNDDNGDGPTIEEQQLNALNGTWTTNGDGSNVKLEGNDAPGVWTNFTMTFNTSGQYTVTDDESAEVDVFGAASGSFTVSGDNATSFTVTLNGDTDFPAAVQISGGTSMTMQFNDLVDGESVGRTKSINGDWVFNLTKSN